MFIPVHKYAVKKNIPRQKIYRLIREHRLKEGVDYVRRKIEVERILVRKDLKI
ncbi:MAG: hypothetical protein N2505_06185 [Endomicrobia bacterium]|nr:hypothetical protein [Endomicrobiia bacterium]